MKLNAVYKKMGKFYVAWVEEMPGVNTQGRTLKEARENLKEALALILEANKTISYTPKSKEYIREPIGLPR